MVEKRYLTKQTACCVNTKMLCIPSKSVESKKNGKKNFIY